MMTSVRFPLPPDYRLPRSLTSHHRLAGPEAELALHEAALIAKQSASVLLCYEADRRCCHRRRVAELLVERHGFALHHLAVADNAG